MAEGSPSSEPRGDRITTQRRLGIAELWKTEDYWAIWLGLLILAFGLIVFLPREPEGMAAKIAAANETIGAEAQNGAPFKSIAHHEAVAAKAGIKASKEPFPRDLQTFTSKPHSWKFPAIGEAFYLSEESAAEKVAAAQPRYEKAKGAAAMALEKAREAEKAAARAGFGDAELNAQAKAGISAWLNARAAADSAKKKTKVSPVNQLRYLIGLCVLLALFFGLGMKAMGHSLLRFARGFAFVFALAVVAYLAAGEKIPKEYGIGYAAWAILFGLLISNTIGTPKWVKPAVQTEFFIKTGLVLLGAEILFGKILSIGVPGIFVAWIVTPTVLITTYWFGQKIIKIPSKTLNITISSDMSVCGVSAAIATAAACRAKKEELTLAVGMSLVFTSIMMIAMPAVIKATGMDHVLGGAWMGGTIDATGAVAAAGAFLSQKALYVAATVKMIQNILIGIVAFFVALYWTTRVERAAGQRVGAMEIWYRFPKFVLGFIGASVIFSLIYASLGDDAGYSLIDQGVIRGFTKNLRGWFFCLAFVSIGLASNFRELAHYFKGGKPLILYVCGQSLNLILTLVMAYIMFFVVFPEVTESL